MAERMPPGDRMYHSEEDDISEKSTSRIADARKQISHGPLPSSQRTSHVKLACTECRRRKIRCKGSLPCGHCKQTGLDCIAHKPLPRKSRTNRKAVEAKRLSDRVKQLEHLLDGRTKLSTPRSESVPGTPLGSQNLFHQRDGGADVHTMDESTVNLLKDDSGRCDYTAHTSWAVIYNEVQDLLGFERDSKPYPLPSGTGGNMARLFEESQSFSLKSLPLPSKDVAYALISVVLDDVCALASIIHRPSFQERFDSLYSSRDDPLERPANNFICLLFSILALGCLFDSRILGTTDYQVARRQGEQFFVVARNTIDLEDGRDIVTLQALIYMNIFLRCTTRLTRCYTHLGVVVTLAQRIGLHRSITTNLSEEEIATRKRTFWAIYNADILVSVTVGLPNLIHDENVDQEAVSPTDSATPPAGDNQAVQDRLLEARIAYGSLLGVLVRVIKEVYPIKKTRPVTRDSNKYTIKYSSIVAIESQLAEWQNCLPSWLNSNDEMERKYLRVRFKLRVLYNYLQLMLYRPFLRFHTSKKLAESGDPRGKRLAASCITACTNILRLVRDMAAEDLLNGAHWFELFALFNAITLAIFLQLFSPATPKTKFLFKDAEAGRDVLVMFAEHSLATRRSLPIVTSMMDRLAELKAHNVKVATSCGPSAQPKANEGFSRDSCAGRRTAYETPSSTAARVSEEVSMIPAGHTPAAAAASEEQHKTATPTRFAYEQSDEQQVMDDSLGMTPAPTFEQASDLGQQQQQLYCDAMDDMLLVPDLKMNHYGDFDSSFQSFMAPNEFSDPVDWLEALPTTVSGWDLGDGGMQDLETLTPHG